MKLILFNGPPRTGKDTSTDTSIAHLFNLGHTLTEAEKFSLPNKRTFAGMMGQDDRTFDFSTGHNHTYEPIKDDPIPHLGVSYRRWQIDFSERFMKPLYGQNVFARLFLQRVERLDRDSIIIVSDCGFQIELDTAGAATHLFDSLLLVRLHRRGFTFLGDSRERVHLDRSRMYPDARETDICADTVDCLRRQVVKTLDNWLESAR